jgi:hypothetical protein
MRWSEEKIEASKHEFADTSLKELWDHAPSKKLYLGTMGAIGLANVGLTSAAIHANLRPMDVIAIWDSTMGSIGIEELAFRSQKIPDFITSAGKSLGLDVRPDIARRSTDALFGLIHAHYILMGHPWAVPELALMGSNFSGASAEGGMLKSLAIHAVHNALHMSRMYLFDGPMSSHFMGGTGAGLLPKNKYTNALNTIMTVTNIGMRIGEGISGIKEILNDKKITDTVLGVRKAKSLDAITNKQAVNAITMDLLKTPSTKGYKFEAGVELAYTTAYLSMPDAAKKLMTPDQYARHTVNKLITTTTQDARELDYRTSQAQRYIDKQVSAKIKKE